MALEPLRICNFDKASNLKAGKSSKLARSADTSRGARERQLRLKLRRNYELKKYYNLLGCENVKTKSNMSEGSNYAKTKPANVPSNWTGGSSPEQFDQHRDKSDGKEWPALWPKTSSKYLLAFAKCIFLMAWARSRVVHCKYGYESDGGDDWFEIWLFYVRVAPYVTGSVLDHLKLRHLRREIGILLEIDRTRVPTSDSASLMLRRDPVDKELSEVMYLSIDTVRVTGGVEFEVYENNDMVLCGSLERWRVFGSMEMRRD
ncbi:hypothetical protein ACFX2B_013959 [Malus domestica]